MALGLNDRSLRRHDPDQVLRVTALQKRVCRPNLSALAAPPSVRRMVAQQAGIVNECRVDFRPAFLNTKLYG